ncbi:purine and uridine phosphorylase, partial [Aspergillus steynii IBT 23096]
MKQLYHEDYTVGWICALPLERAAAAAMLDETHETIAQPSSDNNAYTLGAIHGRNVVIASLAAGVYGISSATAVVMQMKATFPKIEYGLMVGIGGGAPGGSTDIRLGDIVVSRPTGSSPGIVQYDFGKIVGDGKFESTGFLNKPPSYLLNVIGKIESEYHMGVRRIPAILANALQSKPAMRSYFCRPEAPEDELFESEYEHINSGETCDHCDRGRLITRKARPFSEPYVHYGLIASANSLMKHGMTREKLRKEKNILCFEMEAAGLMDHLPCLVIRGICDYSDSHKNKTWQHYAAGTAAAYAKELLASVPLPVPMPYGTRADPGSRSSDEQECLRKLFQVDPYEHKSALKRRRGNRAHGTCEWIIDKVQFQTWLDVPDPEDQRKLEDDGNPNPSILWLHCAPGTGKSTLAITLADELPKRASFYLTGKTLMYFFCEAGSSDHRTASAVLRGLLYQLVQQHPRLLTQLTKKYKERDNLFGSFDSLWRILIELGQDSTTGDKFLIIDGLDELEDSSQEDLLRQIHQTFASFDEALSKIHFLIISRPYLNIREELEIFPNTGLSSFGESQEDIKKFIREQVSQLQVKKRYTKKTCDQVSEILNKKAEGTFVWVGLACKELMRVPQRDALATLSHLPTELYSLFRVIVEKDFQQAQSVDKLQRILEIVVVAEEAFSIHDLTLVCRFDENEELEERRAFIREDVNTCALLSIGENERVAFIHTTAREFLLDPRNADSFFVDEKAAHALLAHRLIEYIIHAPRRPYMVRNDSFHRYGTYYWVQHVRQAADLFRITHETKEFFDIESPAREFSMRCLRNLSNSLNRKPLEYSIFHIIAFWGLLSIGEYLLPEGSKYCD